MLNPALPPPVAHRLPRAGAAHRRQGPAHRVAQPRDAGHDDLPGGPAGPHLQLRLRRRGRARRRRRGGRASSGSRWWCSGTVALGRAFDREREGEAIRSLLLSPAPRAAIYLGKLVARSRLMADHGDGADGAVRRAVLGRSATCCRCVALLLALGTVGFAAAGCVFSARAAARPRPRRAPGHAALPDHRSHRHRGREAPRSSSIRWPPISRGPGSGPSSCSPRRSFVTVGSGPSSPSSAATECRCRDIPTPALEVAKGRSC